MNYHLLADHQDLIPVLARWHWYEWGHHNPDGSYERTLAMLSQRIERNRIPLTYLAFNGKSIVGTASLVESDMDTRRDLSPWLAGVYVDPGFRNLGVATGLVTKVCDKARQIGFETVYLYSNSAIGLYEKLGWITVAIEEYHGRQVEIMKIKL